jgi:hypothetical protein
VILGRYPPRNKGKMKKIENFYQCLVCSRVKPEGVGVNKGRTNHVPYFIKVCPQSFYAM